MYTYIHTYIYIILHYMYSRIIESNLDYQKIKEWFARGNDRTAISRSLRTFDVNVPNRKCSNAWWHVMTLMWYAMICLYSPGSLCQILSEEIWSDGVWLRTRRQETYLWRVSSHPTRLWHYLGTRATWYDDERERERDATCVQVQRRTCHVINSFHQSSPLISPDACWRCCPMLSVAVATVFCVIFPGSAIQ